MDYHRRNVYDEDGEYKGEELIVDEDGNPIPKHQCICAALEPNECVCGAWDDVTDWYYD